MIIIEIDGSIHNFENQNKRDWIREKELEKLGFIILRYKNIEILENIDKVITNMEKICENINNK